jgi:hypothetical protein
MLRELIRNFGALSHTVLIRFREYAVFDLNAVAIGAGIVRALTSDGLAMGIGWQRLVFDAGSGVGLGFGAAGKEHQGRDQNDKSCNHRDNFTSQTLTPAVE